MSPVSNHWPDVQETLESMLDEDALRVTSTVQEINPLWSHIEHYATSLHPTSTPCHALKDHYTWGNSFVVFEILFNDGASWIIRFGMPPVDAYTCTAEQLERKILNEAAALRIVSERTTIPVPKILAYHPVRSTTNPLGSAAPPFVLMTTLPGVSIESIGVAFSENDPVKGDESKRPILQRYLRDLADMQVQLSKIRFDGIGSFVLDPKDGTISLGPLADFGVGPFKSAKEYFEIRALSYKKVAESSDIPEERVRMEFVASLWRTAIMRLTDERDDRGPFPMQHGDLHHENILVDETGHIVGVLDWDCAAAVPWESFAVPSFQLSGHLTASSPKAERLVVHEAFNDALKEAQGVSDIPSGRTLADLHNSSAGHVGSYLAYWMYSLGCDYEHTGNALCRVMGYEEPIDNIYARYLQTGAQVSLTVAVAA